MQVTQAGLDFVQWHQKYFSDARNCPGLFSDAERGTITGLLVVNNTDRPAKELVEDIGRMLMRVYRTKVSKIVKFLIADLTHVPATVSEYFVPVPVIRILKNKSAAVSLVLGMHFDRADCLPLLSLCVFETILNLTQWPQTVRNDFQSAVGKFGISALLFRLVDLCDDSSPAFLRELRDFRASWQRREIERVRLANPGYEYKSAFQVRDSV